jgi:AraC family transcriptional regulator
MMEEITVVEVPPQTVIGLRRRGRYDQIPRMLMELVSFAMERGVQIVGPPVFLCHEATSEDVMRANEEGTADVEVAFPIQGTVEPEGTITPYTLPGGRMAKIIHRGPYDACEPAYARLFLWIEQNGQQITGPIREVYPNDPREVPEDEILTEIYAPIG